jgi:hypothetical protein
MPRFIENVSLLQKVIDLIQIMMRILLFYNLAEGKVHFIANKDQP